MNRLTEEANKRQLISVNQIEFQKGKRTTDHIFVLQTLIDKIVKHEKRKLFVAFIGFTKAYDSINRNDLFFKIKQMEIRGLFLDNLKSLYSSIKYCVKIGKGYIDPIESCLGLKQGCVLSPILFNLFIDDFKEIFNRQCDPVLLFDTFMNHVLYADDLIKMSNSAEGLQTCIDNLEEYCKKWHLTINRVKSKIIIFNESGKILRDYNFVHKNRKMEIVQSVCYLGIDISASGSFSHAKINLKDKSMKAMFPLVDTIWKFNPDIKHSIGLFHKSQ